MTTIRDIFFTVMEIFSPGYLSMGAAPTIKSAPATKGWGSNFVIDSPNSNNIDSVVFIDAQLHNK